MRGVFFYFFIFGRKKTFIKITEKLNKMFPGKTRELYRYELPQKQLKRV